jgi:ATP-dependent protease ClpP protease subunit
LFVVDESLSAKRSAAGRAGAAKRWGARNETSPPEGGDELVCGTASELRRMAEALDGRDAQTLTAARNVSASRVRAFKAEHPNVTNEQLNRRVFCDLDRHRARNNRKLRVVNGTADVAELWLYDIIDSWGGSWGISAAEVVEALSMITAPRIDVHINSGGGEVFEGIAIKRALAAHPAGVFVCIDSLAASIASVIAMAGDTIAIDEAAFMMIHDASGFCIGQAGDMIAMADLLDLISGTIAQTYATRTGKGDADKWRDAMLAETWYDAPKAIAAGLADHLLGDEPEADEPTASVSPLFTTLLAATRPHPEPAPVAQFLLAVKEAVDR